LRSELTAINQYWLHYRTVEQLGSAGDGQDLAQGIHRGDGARGQFTDRFCSRRISTLQVLDPCDRPERKEINRMRSASEVSARALTRRRNLLHSVKDYVSRDLFEA